MSQSKQNFIITVDKSVADKLTAAGFQLVSENGGNYTFLSKPPKNFKFEQFDTTKFAYTNILSV